MERIGADSTVSAQAALQQVAALAAPAGSRIEVTPANGRYVVRVAFKMSALTQHEKGAVTKHQTIAAMRREVRALSAQVMRDLFDYCGVRGIERLSVSCNHTVQQANVPAAATESERRDLLRRAGVAMSCIYRARIDAAAASRITEWRTAPNTALLDLISVDYDGLDAITITQASRTGAREADPEMPLQF